MSKSERFKRKVRSPLPMRGIERRVYTAVFLLSLSGIAWSVVARDWQYLERSGSLVVIVGVGLAWRDFVGTLGNMEELYRPFLERLLHEHDATRPSGIVGAAHDRKRTKITDSIADVECLTVLLRKRIRSIEAAILCFGTFVWGYGSVFGKWLWTF